MNEDNKTFRFILICLFLIFITLYISQATGYYDYQQHKRTTLTKEKIAEFEADIKEGKPIDIKDYLDIEEYDYRNEVSQTGLRLSRTVQHYVEQGMNSTFRFLERLLTNK